MPTNQERTKKKADGRRKRARVTKERDVRAREVRRSNLPLVDRIAGVPDLALAELKSLVEDARACADARLQTRVIESCLRRILSYERLDVIEPRPEQIRTLFRLIYGKGDVLLIARTGFGKSIIFHAYTILTGLITLQLIPLSKLGDEQLADIRRYPGTSPCLVDSRTKAGEDKLLKGIAKGEYTHVLLGPEQASSRSFRKILRTIGLQAKFGLVALDEVHLVVDWELFRPAFTQFGELRTILREDIVWFGCTATLDRRSTTRVL